ncbi:MAG: hypothetical protein M3Y77_22160, partial [Actinomycetota bacterium]|nr:hypothetical protein [Actinomycetota bacterium]
MARDDEFGEWDDPGPAADTDPEYSDRGADQYRPAQPGPARPVPARPDSPADHPTTQLPRSNAGRSAGPPR